MKVSELARTVLKTGVMVAPGMGYVSPATPSKLLPNQTTLLRWDNQGWLSQYGRPPISIAAPIRLRANPTGRKALTAIARGTRPSDAKKSGKGGGKKGTKCVAVAA